MIYEPREDSLLLAEQIKKYAKNKSVLDVGAGSGILAETAINSGAISILASDINLAAISLLKRNGIKAIKSNLFSNVKSRFDLILFNPPYLPQDSREDDKSRQATTGGKMGDEIILKLLKQAPSHLKTGGIILLVISSLTPRTRIKHLVKKYGMSMKILSRRSFFFETLEVWKIRVQ